MEIFHWYLGNTAKLTFGRGTQAGLWAVSQKNKPKSGPFSLTPSDFCGIAYLGPDLPGLGDPAGLETSEGLPLGCTSRKSC